VVGDHVQLATTVRLVIWVSGMVIGSWLPVMVSRICPLSAERSAPQALMLWSVTFR
jgi:hypothetical protein